MNYTQKLKTTKQRFLNEMGKTTTAFFTLQLIFFFFVFFCVLSYISGVHHLGEDFPHVTVFNPTIEVVTFNLRGWCMLDVFLLPAFVCPGHECQDLLSLCDGMHVRTD